MVLLNSADAVYVGGTKANAVYLGATKVWSGDPLAGVSIGDPFMGGYYAGIIDTTVGNIIPTDASQTGLRYALIIAPKSLETTLAYKTTADAAPHAAQTRWDGLTASQSMNSATYPAAQYCLGLTHPADSASAWYLPAMDELEVLYRNLKPTAEANYTTPGTTAAGSFPLNGANRVHGYNPSSDPSGSAYTPTTPAQTGVSAFQSGGAQAIDATGGSTVQYYTATEYDAGNAWEQFTANTAIVGDQSFANKTTAHSVRPVRRLPL